MKKIIFVDDDPDIQHAVKLTLEKTGYEVVIFPMGAPLLKSSYELPDAFILDKQLPDIDGLEMCRKLKSQEKTKNIPVIVLSANPDIKSLAKKAGADKAVEKPFSLRKLREIVAECVG